MSGLVRNHLLRSLRRLFPGAAGDGPTDANLLGRFIQTRDQEAFELLMWRHSALVLNVCWQVLRDEQAVEDAFQATFLVLVRKAKAISRGEALPGWLYRVAHRVAVRARARLARETGGRADFDLDQAPGVATEGPEDAELSRLLHEEVSHLPARYRVPIVCCYLEGQTYAEAAARLGWREGTVSGRLARARELLRRRLARRGVGPAVAAVAAHLTGGAWGAARWSRQVTLFINALRGMASNETAAAGLSSHAAALAEGVMAQMFWSKLKHAAFAVLAVVTLAGLGAGVGAWQVGGQAEPPSGRAERPDGGEGKPQKAAEKPDDPIDDAMRRLRIRQNFKVLALALHNYNDTYTHLPLPALLGKDGKPLLSWRVAILPFIDQAQLYRQFKLDEPWDGPHNKKLIAKMPAVLASDAQGAKQGRTAVQYLVGPGTVFPGPVIRHRVGGGGFGEGPGFPGGGLGGPPGGTAMPGRGGMAPPGGMGGAGMGMPGMGGGGSGLPSIPASIPDGTSNTLLLVEARDPVIWTKPGDVAYHPRKPIPALGDPSRVVFHAAFADGSVTALPQRLDEATLRALISPSGGEAIDHAKIAVGRSGSSRRQEALGGMKERNERLKQEVASLREVVAELREEMLDLRWAREKEKLLAVDPEAAKLRKEREQLDRELKEARDDVRQLIAEIQKLKQGTRK